MTNLLVTGGAGFLGSHFVRSLLAGRLPGISVGRVTVLDSLRYASGFANLAPVAYDKRLDFLPGEVTDAALVDTALRGQDAVVHFAADDPLGTQTLLDAALRHGTGRFVQISSETVYGAPATDAWTEQAALAPTSPPGALRAAADLLAVACHRTHGLGVVVARLCPTYGPGQHPARFVPQAATSVLSGHPVRLPGAGTAVRDWLHVEDCTRAVARIVAGGRAGEIYHVGGSIELADRDLARLIAAELGAPIDPSAATAQPGPAQPGPAQPGPAQPGPAQPGPAQPGPAQPGPAQPGPAQRRALDDQKIRRELGWRPEIEFDTGLIRTLAWYRTNPDWWRPLLPY